MGSRAAASEPNGPGYTWLTVAEIATELRVSKMTVYRRIQDGELPALRISRSLRVDTRELDRYLRNAGLDDDDGAP